MSITREVYAGKYLRVWMPIKVITDENWRICPKCKKELGHKYCPLCGTETEETERQIREDIYDLLQAGIIFHDDDIFLARSFPDYDIVLPNQRLDCGEFLNEEDEIEFSDLEFNENWIKLMKELDKRSIRYEIHNGTVSFLM